MTVGCIQSGPASRRTGGGIRSRTVTLVAALAIVFATTAPSFSQDRFPSLRPTTSADAIRTLNEGAELPTRCLTARIQQLGTPGHGFSADELRSVMLLRKPPALHGEERWVAPDGTIVRYASTTAGLDRVTASDTDGNGRPDLLEQAWLGTVDARRSLMEGLGFPGPAYVEIVLADTGSTVDGYLVPDGGSEGRALIVLEASPTGGASALRSAAAHQMAHAVSLTLGTAVPAAWSETFATWAVARLDHDPGAALLEAMSGRLDRLGEGLLADDLVLAAGNAVWFVFLEEAFGGAAVPAVMGELATGAPAAIALDRAVRRISGEDLEAAFRDFHLWSVLVGERDDGRHFSFGDRLDTPAFASVTHGMPSLSVRRDPAVAALGATSLMLRPGANDDGATVMFEGEISGRWEVDLLLVGTHGGLHRVPLELSVEGRGELTVPLDGLGEIVLLVRNLSIDDPAARSFTWSVHRERGFPFELGTFEAIARSDRPGVLVSWETLSERRLVGFNVVRTRDDSDEVVRVNPVWVPAVGDSATPISYLFIDLSAEAGAPYRYRLEGITSEGLVSLSDPVSVSESIR